MKMKFDYFQIQKKSMSQTDRAEEVDKKWDHLSSFHVFLLNYGPSVAKNWDFFSNIVEISTKLKLIYPK